MKAFEDGTSKLAIRVATALYFAAQQPLLSPESIRFKLQRLGVDPSDKKALDALNKEIQRGEFGDDVKARAAMCLTLI